MILLQFLKSIWALVFIWWFRFFEVLFRDWGGLYFWEDISLSTKICSGYLDRYRFIWCKTCEFSYGATSYFRKGQGAFLVFSGCILLTHWLPHLSHYHSTKLGIFSPILAQSMYKPQQAHWDAPIWVLHYLKGFSGLGLLLFVTHICSFEPIVILTGLVVLSLADHWLGILFLFDIHPFPRKLKSNILFLNFLLKLNTINNGNLRWI